MALYTFGGNPSSVLTTMTGDVVPDYPVTVRVAGTGALVTALFEEDGATPIAQLRSNPTSSDTPGAIRVFKAQDVPAIEYEYNGPNGVVRWYEAARELASQASELAQDALPRSGGTMTGTLQHEATAASAVDEASSVTGDLHDRYRRTADGTMSWGPGTAPRDVTLARTDANTLTLTGNLVVTGQGGSSIRAYTPQDHGAKGDGTTNDAPAIQLALNAARTAGGGWVIVPPGIYRLATLPLRIYKNTRLTLLPGAVFVRAVAGTMLLNGDAAQEFGGYTGHSNILIEGGRWEMQATTSGLTASAMCISLGHARDIIVRNVDVRDVPGYHAIEGNAVKNLLIEGCSFRGFVDPGGRSTSEAIQFDLAAGSGYFGGFGPYDYTPVEDVVVRDCYFGASGTAGTTAWPRGVGSHSSIIGRWHKRIKVTGCTFEGLLREGVRTYAWEDTAVSGCTFIACATGVQSRTVDTARTADTVDTGGVQTSASQAQSGLVITGNTFRDITGANEEGAIYVQGEATGKCRNTTISGNVIEGVSNGKSGIRLEHAQRASVTGNAIEGVTGTAISQSTVEDMVITGNEINDITLSGISANTGTNVLIADNLLRTLGVNGIHIVGGINTKINDNFIRGAGRDSSGYGIRVTTSSVKTTITGNTYLKHGSGNEAINALSITAGNTLVRRWGNDWIGQGNPTDVVDSSTPNLSPYDTGA